MQGTSRRFITESKYNEKLKKSIDIISYPAGIIQVAIVPKVKIEEIKKIPYFKEHNAIYFLCKEPEGRKSLADLLKDANGSGKKYEEYINQIYNEEYKKFKTRIYIGETIRTPKRLKEHDKGKPWWEYGICVRSTIDEGWTKEEIKYLEKYFLERFQSNHGFIVDNDHTAPGSNLNQFQEDAMKIYIEEINFLLEYYSPSIFTREYDVEILTGSLKAKAHQINDKGVTIVFKGSEATLSTSKNANSSLKKRRERLLQQKILEKKKDKLIFTEDYLIQSLSGAAETLVGCNRSKNDAWRKNRF